jgi:hypothetical protein
MLRFALLAAVAGTVLLFDARPGINWGIWATLFACGMLASQWMERGHIGRWTVGLLLLGCAFAWGAVATASEGILVLDLLAAFTAFAIAGLSAPDENGAALTVPGMLLAPIEAPVRGIAESGRRMQQSLVHARREESLPVVRGVAIAVPIVGLFGLALAGADPVFASWRDGVSRALEELPVARFTFGAFLFIAALGAFGLAARGGRRLPAVLNDFAERAPRLGTTERLIILGSVASLFACFLLLQASYLFGNAPAVAGSGVTFAEYARRGFAELTFVAAAGSGLLVVLRGSGARPGDARVLRLLEVAVIGEMALLLASALRKLLLYEEAYGFTVARLFAKGFMIVLALSLVALALEVLGRIDVHRLVRRQAALAAAMLLVFTYWNHEAWITRQNIERFEVSGHFDLDYAARGLSQSAVPAALEAARRIGGNDGLCLERALRNRWEPQVAQSSRWFEYNAAAHAANDALRAATAGANRTGARSPIPVSQCGTIRTRGASEAREAPAGG